MLRDATGSLPIQAVILSGGRARRAGGINKSFLEIEGRPVLEHQLEALRPIFGDAIAVITDRPEDYAPHGIPCISDVRTPPPEPGAPHADDRSSLRGVTSALTAFSNSWVFLLASDMPSPDPALVLAQIKFIGDHLAQGDPVKGVCLRRESGLEPFHAIYHGGLAASARAAWETGLRGGSLSLRRWIDSISGIATPRARDLGLGDPPLDRALANFNHPEQKV